jgi:hypothetical protein
MFQRYLAGLTTAFLLGCASTPALSSDTDRRLSEALDQALPSLVSSGDYLNASRLSFHLATARSRLNETGAACAALSQSLEYYRKALAKDTGSPLHEVSSGDGGDGMQYIRSKFGCTRAQFG